MEKEVSTVFSLQKEHSPGNDKFIEAILPLMNVFSERLTQALSLESELGMTNSLKPRESEKF